MINEIQSPPRNRSRLVAWGLVMALVVIGVIAVEASRRSNTHDYASRRATQAWPEQLILDRSDLSQYLRSQFNVEISDERTDGSGVTIRAGLCQLAGRQGLDASDLLAADATLAIARQPWFQEFVKTERVKMNASRVEDPLCAEQLRHQFIQDLAATDEFRSEFPRFMETAAQERGVNLRWSDQPQTDL